MVEILNTKETSQKILEIIENANQWVIIESPYLKIRNRFKKALEKKNVNVTIVYGKSELRYDQEDYLFDSRNITLLYCDDLHAKIYMNEKECLISSMNLYSFSEKYNFEISMYSKEKNIYDKVHNIANEIIKNSEIDKISEIAKKELSKTAGYCIRTGVKINFDPEKPFSYNAFLEWNKWQNPNYPEKFCHLTGKKSYGKTSFANPILKN